MKKLVVLSLGGSLIIPEIMNPSLLENFKKTLRKHYKTYKFVVVCGGGVIARKYINALKQEKRPEKELAEAGIRATRMNARLMMDLFGKEANQTLPKDMKSVKSELKKNHVVFCGGLRYSDNATSDETAAKLAQYLGTEFINITNVSGLYTADPTKSKNAKLIPHQTWKEFESKALRLTYKAGQHFVLDQGAARIIRKHKIKAYIIGPDFKNLKKILRGEPFTGTEIFG